MSATEGTLVVVHFDAEDSWRPEAPALCHVQAGSRGSGRDLGLLRDDTGEEISERNPRFGELTAVYWAWRNLPRGDFVGFGHYRRYFILDPAVSEPMYLPHRAAAARPGLAQQVAGVSAVSRWLQDYDVVVPQPRLFRGTTVAGQYGQCHPAEDFVRLLELLRERHPGEAETVARFAAAPALHCCNMFIAGWGFADGYLGWLFPLLFELERRVPQRSGFQRRNVAFLAERLMDFYLLRQARTAPLRVLERPLLYLDEKSAAKSLIRY
jgi:hypothetical protein